MQTNPYALGRVAYSIQLDAPHGPALVLHGRSHNPPTLEGISIAISRQTMACIVKRWRALGAPRVAEGVNAAHTAMLAMVHLKEIQIPRL